MSVPARRFWTICETADFLRLSIKGTYALASRGELPTVRITRGRKGIRVDGRELERRLERQIAEGHK